MGALQAFIVGYDPEEQFRFKGMEIFIADIDVYQGIWSKITSVRMSQRLFN